MQTFNELLQRKNDIEKQVDFFSSQLQKIPKNDIGMITEKSELYRVSKLGFDHWFKKLQDINVFINRNYKKENKIYLTEKRFNKMNKILLIPIFATLLSCSAPEVEKNVAVELYPTEKCNLTWYGNGKLLLIDKNHTLPDTIVNSSLNGSSEIDLIIRGYYELKINNCNAANVLLTNKNKTLINFNQVTNGITYQFFNK